jgi:hypothetical protein
MDKVLSFFSRVLLLKLLFRKSNPRTNVVQAMNLADQQMGIPPLLDPEAVTSGNADEKSVMTYVVNFMTYESENHVKVSELQVGFVSVTRLVWFNRSRRPSTENRLVRLLLKRRSKSTSSARLCSESKRPLTSSVASRSAFRCFAYFCLFEWFFLFSHKQEEQLRAQEKKQQEELERQRAELEKQRREIEEMGAKKTKEMQVP